MIATKLHAWTFTKEQPVNQLEKIVKQDETNNLNSIKQEIEDAEINNLPVLDVVMSKIPLIEDQSCFNIKEEILSENEWSEYNNCEIGDILNIVREEILPVIQKHEEEQDRNDIVSGVLSHIEEVPYEREDDSCSTLKINDCSTSDYPKVVLEDIMKKTSKNKPKSNVFEMKSIEETRKKSLKQKKKIFTCSFCSKKLYHMGHFNRHQKLHTGEKPFTCTFCDQKFAQKCNLNRHRVIHMDEKPFSCEFCDKKFNSKDTLHKHKLTHKGKKSFSCKDCDKRFYQLSHLKRHQMIHTDERPFACAYCDKRFNEKASLKKHLQNIHTAR